MTQISSRIENNGNSTPNGTNHQSPQPVATDAVAKRTYAMTRRSKRMTRHQRKFLKYYARCGVITQAAEEAGLTRAAHYHWLELDASGEYQAAFEQADREACDVIEAELRRRAIDGFAEPVIHQGKLAGTWVDSNGLPCAEDAEGARFIPLTVIKKSDALLSQLAKAKLSAFRDTSKVQLDAKVDQNIAGQVQVEPTVKYDFGRIFAYLSEDEILAVLAAIEKAEQVKALSAASDKQLLDAEVIHDGTVGNQPSS
jgi:hypothetical protein